MQLRTERVPDEIMKRLLASLDLIQENKEAVAVCLNTAIKEQKHILGDLTTLSKWCTEYSYNQKYFSLGIEEANKKKYSNCCDIKQSKDDLLERKIKEQHQVVLPHALKEAVYR